MSTAPEAQDENSGQVVEVDWEGDVATVRITHPPVNALDLETLDALLEAFEDVRDAGRALVLTGSGSTLSAGVDLRRLLAEDEDYGRTYLARLSACFRTLFTLPLPTVASVNGHAIAGGCILVCACDQAVAARVDAKIGLSELAVGVPFPAVALDIVRSRVGTQHLRGLVYGASLVGPEDAERVGFVDEVVAPADLRSASFDRARRLARRPSAAYALTKEQLVRDALSPDDVASAFDRQVVTAWVADGTREKVARFLEQRRGR